MESTGVVLGAGGQLERRTIDIPDIEADHALLRVELAGVCGSDVHMWEHDLDIAYPIAPGHEFVAVIEEPGEHISKDSARRPVDVGDAVTVVPGVSCDDCWYCDNMPSRPLTCTDRAVYGFRNADEPPRLHGGMSEHFVLDARAHFYRLPGSIPIELGALVEPLSVATHAIERAFPPGIPHVREGLGIGHSVVVQGAGPIGLLTMAAATAVGAGQVIAVDMIEDRLRMAERFGATDIVNLADYDGEEFIDAIAELTPSGDGPELTVEAVGDPVAFEQALRIPHNGGSVVEVGHYFPAGHASIDPSELIHRQLDVYGSLAYPPQQFDTSIAMLERTADRFPYGDLLDDPVGLNDAPRAFESQAAGETYRATIDPWA